MLGIIQYVDDSDNLYHTAIKFTVIGPAPQFLELNSGRTKQYGDVQLNSGCAIWWHQSSRCEAWRAQCYASVNYRFTGVGPSCRNVLTVKHVSRCNKQHNGRAAASTQCCQSQCDPGPLSVNVAPTTFAARYRPLPSIIQLSSADKWRVRLHKSLNHTFCESQGSWH